MRMPPSQAGPNSTHTRNSHARSKMCRPGDDGPSAGNHIVRGRANHDFIRASSKPTTNADAAE